MFEDHLLLSTTPAKLTTTSCAGIFGNRPSTTTSYLKIGLEMLVTQRIGHVPANADQNRLDWKSPSLGIQHGPLLALKAEVYPMVTTTPLNATEPVNKTSGKSLAILCVPVPVNLFRFEVS